MDYDAIVVGSGAGGAAAAARLVDAGWRVLLIERGRRLVPNESTRDEAQMVERRIAGDDRPLRLNGHPERLAVGSVVGGGTALYGAAMVRPADQDFEPSVDLPEWITDTLQPLHRSSIDWPFGADELEPYFEQLEDLYEVGGDWTEDRGELGQRQRPYRRGAPDLTAINRRVHERLVARGRSPFQLPLAIDWRRCRRCAVCPGFACPNDARRSAFGALIVPAQRRGRLELWDGTEVVGLRRSGRRVTGVRIVERSTGLEAELTARVVVAAAGALGTPVLLLKSGFGTDLPALGRFHMVHYGVLAAAVFTGSIGADHQFHKQLGYAGHHRIERDGHRHKLGMVQAIPAPGARTVRSQLGAWLPEMVARWAHRRLFMFGGLVADVPQARNRVWVDRTGTLRLERAFHRYDLQRGEWLKARIAADLRACRPLAVVGLDSSRSLHLVAHQVGTCRMGFDRKTSVTDADGRVHGFDNLYVADGSLMPFSLGVGPALTIGALGMRVVDRLLGRRAGEVGTLAHNCRASQLAEAGQAVRPSNITAAALPARREGSARISPVRTPLSWREVFRRPDEALGGGSS